MTEFLAMTKDAFGITRSEYDGWSRDVKPVPKSGKVKFSDIGNLTLREHTGAKDVDLASDIAQQIMAKQDVKPIDPKDFRGAIWAMGTKLNDDFDLGPPEPDTWNYGFLNNFAGSRSSCRYDAGKEALELIADVRSDEQINWGKKTETAAIYYVGRFPAGTRLKVEMSMENRNEDRYGTQIEARVRGWERGWFDGEYYEYVEFAKANRGDGFGDFSDEFTVLGTHRDIWVTCEVLSNEPRYAGGGGKERNIGYYKNWKISLA